MEDIYLGKIVIEIINVGHPTEIESLESLQQLIDKQHKFKHINSMDIAGKG